MRKFVLFCLMCICCFNLSGTNVSADEPEPFGMSLIWRQDGKQVAVGTDQNKVLIYDSDLQFITEKATLGKYILDMAWSPNLTYLAVFSSSPSATIEIFNAETFEIISSQEASGAEYPRLAWSPDETQMIVSAGYNAIILALDPIQKITTLEGHSPDVHTVYWESNNNWVLTGDRRHVRIWDANSFELLRTIKLETNHGFINLAISPDETLVAIPARIEGGDFSIWNLSTGELIQVFDAGDYPPADIAWQGNYLATVDFDDTIKVWDTTASTFISIIPSSELIRVLAWQPNTEMLTYSGNGANVQILDPFTSSFSDFK